MSAKISRDLRPKAASGRASSLPGAPTLLALALVFLLPQAASAEWDPVTAAAMFARSQERGTDQASHPDYLQRVLPLCAGDDFVACGTDPYRLHWDCPAGTSNDCVPRGRSLEIRFANRYRALLHGRMFAPLVPFEDPVTGRRSDGPFPAVLLLSGGNAPEWPYRALSQGLAEAGYVVLFVEAQGDGPFSDRIPPDPDPSTSENEYCVPGAWQEPQEMGIRERGPCAGQDPPPDEPVEQATGLPSATWAGFATNRALGSQELYDEIARVYHERRARKTFAALDAAGWLLSPENPGRSLIHPQRLGIAGHSLGAHAALLAGNGDPQRRFKAAVSWDGFGRLGSVAPRVPTMFQQGEQEELGPRVRAPDPDELPGAQNARRFLEARVPTMVLSLAGSTHQEWNYIPTQLQCGTLCNSSRDGERVALYYTQAWFDRWLKSGRRQRYDARRRLLARAFDESADRSSIGQGTWNALTQRNAPYLIGGESVSDHLSPFFRSFYAFDGRTCDDLRSSCRERGTERRTLPPCPTPARLLRAPLETAGGTHGRHGRDDGDSFLAPPARQCRQGEN